MRTASKPPPASRPVTRWPCARIALGEPVRRYNQIIGFATQPIARRRARARRTTSAMGDFERDYAFCPDVKPTDYVAAARPRSMGIRRADGRVATRNYIGILTSGELLGAPWRA